MSTLVRDSIRVIDGLDALTTETLDQARQTLGYMPQNNPNALAASTARARDVFTRLGIEQFTPASVAEYKEAKLRKANRRSRFHDFCNGAGIPIGILLIVGGGITSVISVIESHYIGLLALLPLLMGIFMFRYCFRDDIPTFRWNHTPIQNYKDEIPLFALSRAIEIKRECPEALIYIDALQFERMTGDPFLVVAIDGYLYHVDVWDEPTFEGRRG